MYGIVFKNNSILVCGIDEIHWGLPGGTVEDNESLEDTLIRELMEEVDVTIKNISYLGIQKAEVLNDESKLVYQVRYVADIENEYPSTPDPDSGHIYSNFTKTVDFSPWMK